MCRRAHTASSVPRSITVAGPCRAHKMAAHAKATGLDTSLPNDLVNECLRMTRASDAMLRAPRGFGPKNDVGWTRPLLTGSPLSPGATYDDDSHSAATRHPIARPITRAAAATNPLQSAHRVAVPFSSR